MDIRYGLVGCGMMGQEHIRNIALLEGAYVSALTDPDSSMLSTSEKLASESGHIPETYLSLSDLLSADVCDAYIIASPNDTHRDILADVLATPKPVLCEKPLCTTSSDCRDIISLSSGRSAPVWVAMEYRYMPPIRRLIDEVRSGRAGVPVMMTIREHRFPFLEKVDDWNRFNIRTGGTMIEKCCHFWDLMRLTLDSDPVRIYASAGRDVNHLDESYSGATPDILDNGFVVVDFENGCRGMLDLCMFAEGVNFQEEISVTGSLARLDALIPPPLRFFPNGETSRFVVSERTKKNPEVELVEVDSSILIAGDHHGSTYYQHCAFLELVRSGGSVSGVTLEDGLWSVLIGEAAEESSRLGKVVDLC